ncbi:MAG: ATP synthase F1 subunit gamma [Lachnospirales bacterium]
MASMRDIKRRIKSVSSTQQITKAMNLVASSKLTRAKTRFNATKPYFNAIQKVIVDIVKGSNGVTSPYLKDREGKKVACIVISGDRGLCGGYNTNVCKAAYNLVSDKEAAMITIGAKARDYFSHKHINISEEIKGISENPTYDDARKLGEKVVKMFADEEVDEVYIAYTEYISTIASEPKLVKLLPLDPKDFADKNENSDDKTSNLTLTIYEPDEEEVLNYIIPKYVNTVIYGALVESAVCELGARMTAMDSATENAADMISSLNLVYNRVRQGAITQEITEIVSGSNALE